MGADRITSGPLGTADQDALDSPGSIVVDQVTGYLGVVTQARAIQTMQQAASALSAQSPLTTITTAQTMLTQNFALGELNVLGRTISVTGFVIFTTPAATPTVTIAIKLGATTLCTITTAAVAGSQTNAQLQFSFQFTVAAIGAAGSIEAHGQVIAQLAAALGTAIAAYADQNIAVVGSLNLTIAQAMTVTIAASSTLTSATLRLASVEVLA